MRLATVVVLAWGCASSPGAPREAPGHHDAVTPNVPRDTSEVSPAARPRHTVAAPVELGRTLGASTTEDDGSEEATDPVAEEYLDPDAGPAETDATEEPDPDRA